MHMKLVLEIIWYNSENIVTENILRYTYHYKVSAAYFEFNLKAKEENPF